MWSQKKMFEGVEGTRTLPALFVSPASIMFTPVMGSEVSESILSNFNNNDDRAFVSCLLGGLVPVQVSQRKEGLDSDVRLANQQVWSVILAQFQGIQKTEAKKQILSRFAHDYLGNEQVKECARLFGVLSSSPASRPKYFDELAQLWSPYLESEEELMEVVNNLVAHGMIEIDPGNCCIRVPIPLVYYYRSLISVEESIQIYERFLSPTASILHKAALHDYTEVAKVVLEKNTSPEVVDARDSGGWTPLLFAAQNASYEILKLLLEKGANIKAVESTNQNALHRACAAGSLPCVKLLVEKGVPLNHAEQEGITPIVVAIGSMHKNVVDYLLSKKAIIPKKYKPTYEQYLEEMEEDSP